MASRGDIETAFRQSGVGRSPTEDDYSFYANYPDAGKVEGDIRAGGWGASGAGGQGAGAQITPPDMTKLTEQAFQALKPYYVQIAKESRGDFTRATQILDEDYSRGTRIAKEDYARKAEYERIDLQDKLASLGLDFRSEQEKSIDSLNKRGMAVAEAAPGQEALALRPTEIIPGVSLPFSMDAPGGAPLTSTVAPPPAGIGRGAVELARLTEDQKLRQQAIQRASAQNLQNLGIAYKRYTAPGETDRTKMGAAELEKTRGGEDLTRQQQLKEQELAQEQRREVLAAATGAAGLGLKEVPTSLTEKYLKGGIGDFIKTGSMV